MGAKTPRQHVDDSEASTAEAVAEQEELIVYAENAKTPAQFHPDS
jgi:hypothetical protein